jgi:hypothetical protein
MRPRIVLPLALAAGLASTQPAAQAAGFASPLTLSFAEFYPMDDSDDFCRYLGSPASVGGVERYLGPCCLQAAVHLPDGATVDLVVFWVFDDHLSHDFSLSLRRRRNGTNAATTSAVLAAASTSGASSSMQLIADGTVDNAVIDGDLYVYYVKTDVCMDADPQRILAAQIYYSE